MIELFANVLVTVSFCVAGSNEVVEIGQEEQMFLDDYMVDRMENVVRRVNQAGKYHEPVIRPDRPWEGNSALIFGSALYDRDDGIFKIWYHCGGGHVAYAESSDGISWRKPELDVVVKDGKRTNIVIERGNFGLFYEIFGVIKDNEDPDPSRRYKAGFLSIERDYRGEYQDPYHLGSRRGLGVAVSPDGIHWSMENEFASYEICDISRFFWDSLTDCYVVYGRTKLTPENNDGRWRFWGWGRAVTRIESMDFRNWSEGELVLAADENDPEGSEIYSMSVFPYQGVYVGMVQMFYGLSDQGNLEIQLAISRDGREFERVEPRVPFIPEGQIGEWDRFNISLGCMPPVYVDDEMWFYYGGRTYRHGPYNGKDTGPSSCHIGLAKIKTGRFVSLEASFDGGTVLTKPLALQGSRLFVNANAEFGSIQVTLLDEQEGAMTGWQSEIAGINDVRIPVSFEGGGLDNLRDEYIRIRFEIRNAQVFGVRVE